MTFDEMITNHSALTLGDLGDEEHSTFFNAVAQMGLQDKFPPQTLLKDIPGLLAELPPETADRLRATELTVEVTAEVPPEDTTSIPGVEDLKAITAISPREGNGRMIIGSLFCLVMAFTIIVFTMIIAMVAVHRMEFPSTTLTAVIVLPTMYVAWFYMGIINKERRDILSALVGSKISPSAVVALVEAIRKPKV